MDVSMSNLNKRAVQIKQSFSNRRGKSGKRDLEDVVSNHRNIKQSPTNAQKS